MKPSGCSEAALTYSGGTAPALDRLPCYALMGTRSVYSVLFDASYMHAVAPKVKCACISLRARRGLPVW